MKRTKELEIAIKVVEEEYEKMLEMRSNSAQDNIHRSFGSVLDWLELSLSVEKRK